MPIFSSFLNETAFTDLYFNLNGSKIMYGAFIQNVVDFLIISFVIFLFVRTINKLKNKEEKKEVKVTKTNEEKLLEEIRDLLKKKEK